jgi:hypothetical protein
MDWFDNATREFDMMGDIARRDLSQIHIGGTGAEVDRVNCYGNFPWLIYYFNPSKPYGEEYLIDLTIATEYCATA